jgi:hypothetical protein
LGKNVGKTEERKETVKGFMRIKGKIIVKGRKDGEQERKQDGRSDRKK